MPPTNAPAPWQPWKVFLVTFTICTFVLGGAAAGLLIAYMNEIPLVSDLKEYKPSLSTKIYDANGNLITQLYVEQRTLIPLSKIPLAMQQAIIATEDTHFYQHWGLDIQGIIRAAIVDLLHHRIIEGASTITQQLARNLFLTRERTFSRKIKEAILAIQIERSYTKKEILEMYLNQIYFGNGAYGIESAARTYFGEHADELNLSECATLAGIPKSPNDYNPIHDIVKATRRRDVVLDKMVDAGYITRQVADETKAMPIVVKRTEVQNAPYFTEYVRQQLETVYGSNAIYKGGLLVYTTLDLNLQQMAQDAIENGLDTADKKAEEYLKYFFTLGQKPTLQGALLVMDPHTGYIKAMVGGRDFSVSQFNRAVQAERQPGSSFKPFIYSAAIDNGFTESDIIEDAPIVYTDASGHQWKPSNYEDKFFGPTTIRTALTHSRNVVTVKLLDKIGINTAVNYAKKMGIQSPLNRDLTLALGTSDVNLLEMTDAYCTLANQGIHVEPMSIISVKDSYGRTLEQHVPQSQEVLSAKTAYIVTNMLQNVINEGTGEQIRRLGFTLPAAGKTGTTNDFSDAWFMGYTPDLCTGVWVGYDDRRSIGKFLTGGIIAAPIWEDFMKHALEGQPPKDFPVPAGIKFVKVCDQSGQLATPYCKRVEEVPFAAGTEPTRYCQVHQPGSQDFLSKDLSGAGAAPAPKAPAGGAAAPAEGGGDGGDEGF